MNLSMLLDMAAAAEPNRIAVGRHADGVTFDQLLTASALGSKRLGESGAGSVAYLGPSSDALAVAVFSSAKAGIPFVPLNYRLSTKQLRDIVARLPSPMVIAEQGQLSAANEIGIPIVSARTWWARGPMSPMPGAKSNADLSQLGPQTALVLFTSGTTAAPKGALLTHDQLVTYVLSTVEFGSAADNEATLVSMPNYHVAGIANLLTSVYAQRRIVYLAAFDPGDWLRMVAGESITTATLVPTMLARIVSHLKGATAGVPSLRFIAYGAARMPPAVLRAALVAFPEVGFVQAYGLTETSSTIAVLTPEDHRAALARGASAAMERRLQSVGRLVPGVEAQIRADGRRKVLPPGQRGELWVRGPQVSSQYLSGQSAVDAEGWFHTRDHAEFDDDGYLFIIGRSDDTIIRGGENISPAEIEDVLLEYPGMSDAAVVGVGDQEWGERIVAVVVLDGGELDVDDIKKFVNRRLRGSRTPDQVTARMTLPYGPTGKLLRSVLRSELDSRRFSD
jgi:acyl-CoA synthetase (AMP-forming)/AMP-acid ligase II